MIPGPLRKPAPPGSNDPVGEAAPADLRGEQPEETDVQKLVGQAKEAPIDVAGWLDSRTGGSGFLTGMLYRKSMPVRKPLPPVRESSQPATSIGASLAWPTSFCTSVSSGCSPRRSAGAASPAGLLEPGGAGLRSGPGIIFSSSFTQASLWRGEG